MPTEAPLTLDWPLTSRLFACPTLTRLHVVPLVVVPIHCAAGVVAAAARVTAPSWVPAAWLSLARRVGFGLT